MKKFYLSLTLLIAFTCTSYAQLTTITSNYIESYQDYIVPSNIESISFEAKGGDAGFAGIITYIYNPFGDDVVGAVCVGDGGQGALSSASFNVGNGPGQITPGSTIRTIVGGKGENRFDNNDYTGSTIEYSGGGGGTAVLLRYLGAHERDWKILVVAGGGGGAYVGTFAFLCAQENNGSGGSASTSGTAGDGVFPGAGGSNGYGGYTEATFSGGGGGWRGEGEGYYGCSIIPYGNVLNHVELSIAGGGAGWYRHDYISGGSNNCLENGLYCQNYFYQGGVGGNEYACTAAGALMADGGYGFGGGGAGAGAGGGGGGYSGGGGGGLTGTGGGGGSFVSGNAFLQGIAPGGITNVREGIMAEHGFVNMTYYLPQPPVAFCPPDGLTVALNEDGIATITIEDADANSYDPEGTPITLAISQDTFDCSHTGNNGVILTVTDGDGMSSECIFNVSVIDDEKPEFTSPLSPNGEGTWQNVGNPEFSDGQATHQSLAMDGSTPYVAFSDYANDFKTSVMTFNGTNWEYVGSPGFSAGNAGYQSLAMDGATPYVAFRDVANGGKTSVMTFNGTNWEYVGSPGFSAGSTAFQSLAMNSSTPYVAFNDVANGNKTSVMTFNGTSWEYVGNPGFSAGSSTYQSLALDGNTPYVAYRDSGNGSKTTVMKFDGTNWVNVGNPGFSDGQADYQSLALDGSTPYVAYRNRSYGNMSIIKKFDGTDWVHVGQPFFFYGLPAENQSLALNGDTPYLAFRYNWDQLAVYKLNSTTSYWTQIGSFGFSSGPAQYPSLALDGSTPYIAFAENTKTTVMKFEPSVLNLTVDQGQCTYSAPIEPPIATDNCSINTFYGPNPAGPYPIGNTTVTWRATDTEGNEGVYTQIINVTDSETTLSCPENITQGNDIGTCGAVVNYDVTATASSCINESIQQTAGLPSGSEFPIGTTTNTFVITNGSENTTTCSFDVTITDSEAPSITCLADISINNSPGECYAEVILTEPTVFDLCTNTGNAINFDGNQNSLVNLNHAPTLPTWTIETWINFRSIGTDNFSSIYSIDNGFTGFFLEGRVINWYNQQDGYPFSILNGATEIPFNEWHHIAITYDGTTLTAYLDGVNDGSVASSGQNLNGNPVTIGSNAPYNERLFGAMDEFRIWDSARTQAEIQANMDSQINAQAGLSLLYHFNQGIAYGSNPSITTVEDDSGNGYNGTLNNFELNGITSNWVEGQSLGPTITNNAPATFAVGNTTVTWTATDAAGNMATCNQIITVTDNEAPVITCPSPTPITAIATSVSGAVVSWNEPTISDNCGILNQSLTTSPTSGLTNGSVFPIGTTFVSYQATDTSSSTTGCNFNVIVTGLAPVIVCPANITVNNDSGICGAIVDFEAIDTVGIPASVITYSHVSGSEFPVGTTTVTATATNAVGSSECTFTITVNDNEVPALTCPSPNASYTANEGLCTASLDFSVSPTDNCGIASTVYSINGSMISYPYDFPVGTTTVDILVTDIHNNISECSFDVVVTDNEAPTITCPGDFEVDNDAGECGAVITFNMTSTDNCPNQSIVQTDGYPSGTLFPVGTTTNTFVVTDASGNNTATCSFDVTVEDTEAPVVNCAEITIVLDGNGSVDIVASQLDDNSTDNCEIASYTISQENFTCADTGGDLDQLIITEYIDGPGFNDCIEIYNGTGNPVELTDNYSISVYTDGSTTPTVWPLLGTLATDGSYVVCQQFSDAESLGVVDLVDGIMFDGNDAISLDHIGNAVDIIGIIGNDPGTGWSAGSNQTNNRTLRRNNDVFNGNISNTNSGLGSEWTSYGSSNMSGLGSHDIEIVGLSNNVLLTVTDIYGNASTCEAAVTVVDNTAPNAVAQDVVVQLDALGNGSTSGILVNDGSSDVCGIASLVLDQNDFTCADIATNPNLVTLTVTDVNGNTATATANVTVVDSVAPNAIAQNAVVVLDASGNGSITVGDINNGSNDACGIDTMTVAPNTFDCSNVGNNTVTLTVTDNNGNVSTATANAIVQDNTDPTAVCQAYTVTLDATGVATIDPADVDGGSTDACGILSLSVDIDTFGCNDLGDNNVVLTVTDKSGNTSSCTAVVTVEGDLPSIHITEDVLPELCQGDFILLTANSDLGVAWEWFLDGIPTGDDTETIEASQDGIYGVNVTSATNCTTYEEYRVTGFDLGALISAYTIVADEYVHLHGGNLVQSGGVGAMNPTVGNIKLQQASNIVGFAQAATFNIQAGSTIGTQVTAPANPIIPAFVYNTSSTAGSPNITANVDRNINGSVYNTITVKSGVTVTFTQPNVYINDLRTFKDAAIEFTGCTNLYINEQFHLAEGGVINSDGNYVTIYVDDDVIIEAESDVRARIHANDNVMLVKGATGNNNQAGTPTYMTGLFIANKVHSTKNTIWNQDPLCDPCPIDDGNRPDETIDDTDSNDNIAFRVSAWPNPSNTIFNLRVISQNITQKANIYIFDMNNKLVHTTDVSPQEQISFGEKLEGGIYFVKVVQGKNTKIVRLVKY